MADDSSQSGQKEPDSSEGGRIWRGLRSLLFGNEGEQTLRKELEDAIDEYDEDEGAKPNNGDLSPVERQMVKNLLHFSEHTVDDVAVPRADIIWSPCSPTPGTAASRFTRKASTPLWA